MHTHLLFKLIYVHTYINLPVCVWVFDVLAYSSYVFLWFENVKIAADVMDEEKKGDTHTLTVHRMDYTRIGHICALRIVKSFRRK